jgi:hypothetical protein
MDTSRDGNRDGNRDRGGRVIVGVDGSLGSLGALRRAMAEARHRGAQLCAVRVVSQELSWVGALCDHDLAVLHRQLTTRSRTRSATCHATWRRAASCWWALRAGRWSTSPTGRTTCWSSAPASGAGRAAGGTGR